MAYSFMFQNRYLVFLFSLLIVTIFSKVGAAQEGAKRPPAEMKKVGQDLYFHFDYDSSNSIIWVTEEGVLVIDTRQHPRGAKDLLEKIGKITDKPIRWAGDPGPRRPLSGKSSLQRAGRDPGEPD